MNAVARDIFTPAPVSRRGCYKCGQRWPVEQMKKRRTPAGGAIYTCPSCAKPTRTPR